MHDFLHRISRHLGWLRPLAVVAGLASIAVASYATLLEPHWTDLLLIPAILALCWSLLLYSLVTLFASPAPAATVRTGYFRRLWLALLRGLLSLMALAFVLSSAVLLWMSVRLLTTGIG